MSSSSKLILPDLPVHPLQLTKVVFAPRSFGITKVALCSFQSRWYLANYSVRYLNLRVVCCLKATFILHKIQGNHDSSFF